MVLNRNMAVSAGTPMIARLLFPPLASCSESSAGSTSAGYGHPFEVCYPHTSGSHIPSFCRRPHQLICSTVLWSRSSGTAGLAGPGGFHCPRSMKLPPGAPFGIAMLTHLPFSLPKDFQPSAVQDQMQGPSSFPAQGNPQAPGALAEGGIVRHRQFPLQQVKQGPEKPFGSPQGQMKDAAHHQQGIAPSEY